MNDFTILHLSDLHINQIGERLSLLMENLLIDIKNEMKFVDNIIIVITGDLNMKSVVMIRIAFIEIIGSIF